MLNKANTCSILQRWIFQDIKKLRATPICSADWFQYVLFSHVIKVPFSQDSPISWKPAWHIIHKAMTSIFHRSVHLQLLNIVFELYMLCNYQRLGTFTLKVPKNEHHWIYKQRRSKCMDPLCLPSSFRILIVNFIVLP